MFLTPEMIILALVFKIFRACSALFFQKTFSYKREKAPLFSVFLLAPAARFSSKSMYFCKR